MKNSFYHEKVVTLGDRTIKFDVFKFHVKLIQKLLYNMKCPNCGYDKILPMYKFCPKCKSPLKAQAKEAVESESTKQTEQPNTKLVGMLLMSYKKAIQDPKGFGDFCKKHPNDSKRLWNKWVNEGRDLTALEEYNPTSTSSSQKPSTNQGASSEHQAAVEGSGIKQTESCRV